jgi:hypothetical protein
MISNLHTLNKIHSQAHKNIITGYVNVTGPKSSPAVKDMLKNKMREGRICMNK